MRTLVAPKPRHDHKVPEADALIAEARARRRRRWLFGLLSVALVSGAMATWLGRGPGGILPVTPRRRARRSPRPHRARRL